MTDQTIFEPKTPHEILRTFAVMHELRPLLVEASYVETVQRVMQQGYRLLALDSSDSTDSTDSTEGGVLAVAGFRLSESLSFGKFLYVDDLVTKEDARSRGAGAALLARLRRIARDAGCRELHLDSGVQRHAAHRFYLRERMDITCYHFREVL